VVAVLKFMHLNSGVAFSDDVCIGGLDDDDFYFNRIMELVMMMVILPVNVLYVRRKTFFI
jgi:hypothetical protein